MKRCLNPGLWSLEERRNRADLGNSTVTVQIEYKNTKKNKVTGYGLSYQFLAEMNILNDKILKCNLNTTQLLTS